jgi:serologically defined colon cancer antigen 8
MAIDETWLETVNKKIALLTKEVFRLHAESVDRKDDVARLQSQLEDELAASITNSKAALDEAERSMHTFKEDLDAIVRQTYEDQFKLAQKKYDDQRAQMEDCSHKLVEDVSTRMISLRQQVAELKRKAELQMSAFSKSQQELERASGEILAGIQERHKQKLGKHVTAANKEYNDLVIANAKREHELTSRFESEKTDLRKKLAGDQQTAASALLAQQKKVEQRLRELEKQRDEILVLIDELKLYLLQQQNDIDAKLQHYLQQKNALGARQLQEVAVLKEKIEKMRAEHAQNCDRLRQEMAAADAEFQAKLHVLREQVEDERKRHEAAMRQLEDSAKSSSAETDSRQTELVAEHNRAIDELNKKHQAFLEQAKQKERDIRNEMAGLQRKHEVDIQSIKTEIFAERQNFESRIADMKQKHLKALGNLKADHERQLSRMREELRNAKESSSTSSQHLLDQIETLKKEIDRIKAENEVAFAEKKRSCEEQLKVIRQNHQQTVDSIKLGHRERLIELEQTKDARIREMRQRHDERMKALREAHEKRLKVDSDSLQKQIEDEKRSEMEALKLEWSRKLEDIRRRIVEKTKLRDNAEKFLSDECTKRENQIKQLKRELDELTNEWAAEKSRMNVEFAAKLSALQTSNADIERKHEESKRMKEEEFNQQMAQLTQELNRAKDQKEASISKLNEQIESLRRANAVEIDHLTREIAEADRHRTETIRGLNEEIETLKNEMNSELTRLNSEHQMLIEKLTAELEAVRSRNVAELDRREQLLAETEQTNANLLREIQSKLSDQERQQFDELSRLKQQHEQQIQELSAAQQKELQNAMRELDELRREMENQRLNQEQMLSNEEREYNAKMEALKNQYETERSRAIMEMRELEAEKKVLIGGLELEIKDWEDKFNNRGPRPEDLDRIRELEELIRTRTEQYERVVDKTKRMQADLIGTEISVNKVFTEKPRVGVLSALERKVKRDQLIAQVGSIPLLPPIGGNSPRVPPSGSSDRRIDRHRQSPR